MRAYKKYKGKRIIIRTSVNIEGSIMNIYSDVKNRFGFSLKNGISSRVILWDESNTPKRNAEIFADIEIKRIVKMHENFIDAINRI